MLAAIKVKMSGSENESEQEHKQQQNISPIKGVTRKIHVAVVQQQRQRNVEKSVLHVQSCFLLIERIVVVVLSFSMPSPLRSTRFYFCESKL